MRMSRTTSLVWLAAALAAASVFVAAAPLPWLFAGDSGSPVPRPTFIPGASTELVSIDPILELSPFGRLVDAVTGASARQAPPLGLVLHGVVIAEPTQNSAAIISGGTEPASVHRIGAEITATVTLVAVARDHVELLVDGQTRKLSFPEQVRPSATDPEVAEGDLGALRQMIAGAAADYSAASDPAPAEAANPPEDLAARIERYRQSIREDPQMLLDELGLAEFEDGYRVSMTASSDLLSSGLIPGDIVSTVNGQQVGNIDRDVAIFDDVIDSGRVTLGIFRQGARVIVSLPLK